MLAEDITTFNQSGARGKSTRSTRQNTVETTAERVIKWLAEDRFEFVQEGDHVEVYLDLRDAYARLAPAITSDPATRTSYERLAAVTLPHIFPNCTTLEAQSDALDTRNAKDTQKMGAYLGT